MYKWYERRKQEAGFSTVSMSAKLKKLKKITPEFEIMLSNIPLEDIIALKLELASKSINNMCLGFPIWTNLHTICRQALLKYAICTSSSLIEAAGLTGMRPRTFNWFCFKYRLINYFSDLININYGAKTQLMREKVKNEETKQQNDQLQQSQ